MSLPPGLYHLRSVPNWVYPPPEVGGMYASYRNAPNVTVSAEGPGIIPDQVWEVTPEGDHQRVLIRPGLLGESGHFMHCTGFGDNDPIMLGPPSPFILERSPNAGDRNVYMIRLAAAPREVGVNYCVGTKDRNVVTRAIPVDGRSDIPGWEFIPSSQP
ncbi:hypothetical protein OPQ81_010421 [Rhizoctonia solani]|nr:hypothetical protein OPQ81_011084 [Rhizoctonia solani]KAJ1305683.1 hypothetical protein OPQ81_010421 [Rhizoctonia solani]